MSGKANIVEVTRANFATDVVEESFLRPVLVDFWAAWCGPCQMLMPILAKVVEDLDGAVRLAKVNSDENQDLAAEYGVRSLPTVMLFKNGKPVDQFMGAVPESQVRAFIDRHLPKESDFALQAAQDLLRQGRRDEAEAKMKAILEKDPRHMETALALAGLYLEDGRLDEAGALLQGPLSLADEAQVAELRARLELARLAALVEDPEARLGENPDDPDARLARGARRALAGDYADALEDFLAVLARHRSHRDGAARRALLAVFDLLGPDHPLVNEYRPKMARLLY